MNAPISPRTALVILRSAKLFLLAVVVGVGNVAAGLVVSIISVLLLARRVRPALDERRVRREHAARRAAKQAEWDARWESWGGRV